MTNSKRSRRIFASSHIDSHNEMLTKEALEKMVISINCRDKMIRLGVDHRRDFPPKGVIENAELLEKNGYYYIEADFVEYEKTEIVDWDNNLIKEFFDFPFQFAEVDLEENLETAISIDPHNFNSYPEAINFAKNISTQNDFEVKVNFHGRKSDVPDPEIVFTFAKSVLLFYLLKPTLKKIGENLADSVADRASEETKKLIKFIEKTLKELFFKCVPKARPVTIVFDLPGDPHIELIARTRNEKLVLKGLRQNKLDEIRQEMETLSKNVKIAKAQFLLSSKGEWVFNYLITETGETIGKKEGYKKREHRLEIMSLGKKQK